MVFGLWSVFCPPFAVPPLSTTWKVILEIAVPKPLSGGVNVKLAKLAAVITCPAVTFTPFSLSVPAVGKVVIITLCNAFADVSLGSVKPKLPAFKLTGVSSRVVTVLLPPSGASFTEVTVNASVLVAVALGWPEPSLTV